MVRSAQPMHHERHSSASETVRDVVIGMADGLTVPFALAAGLAGAINDTSIVVTAGLAEVAAGAIAMGLGGYLAARTDVEHYRAERNREFIETESLSNEELREVEEILSKYGLNEAQAAEVAAAIAVDRTRWVDFMMRFELGLEEPDPRRAPISAMTIGGSYIVGGLIPLLPYMAVTTVGEALPWSVGITEIALFAFGWAKGAMTGQNRLRSALQTVAIGTVASAAAFALARAVG